MKIIAITDLHAKKAILPALMIHLQSADLLLLCGDITHFGRSKEIAEIIQLLRKVIPRIYAVSGNCEYPEVESYLQAEDISLNASIRQYQGFQITGLSGSLPCPGKTPNEYGDEEYEALLAGLSFPAGDPIILVTHQPPYNTLNDQVSPGFHVGSKSIRRFIETIQPVVCFTGHIHEGIAIDRIGQTHIVNPGPASAGNFAIAEFEGKSIKNIQLRNLFSGKDI